MDEKPTFGFRPSLVPKNPEFSNLPIAQTPGQAAFDSRKKYCQLDLVRHLPAAHLASRMSIELESITRIRRSSILLAILGVYSSITSRLIGVERHGRFVPTNLMVALELQSGTAKTRIIDSAKAAIEQIINRGLTDLSESIKQLPSDGDEIKALIRTRKALLDLKKTFFITNATPEGIESHLNKTNGFFNCASSEQGLFNSMLGLSYGNRSSNNNDLLLSAFAGEYMSTVRANPNRVTFDGYPVGAVVLFAQSGGIDSLLQSSASSGLSERFLKAVERDRFGEDMEIRAMNPEIVAEYAASCARVFEPYIMGQQYLQQPAAPRLPWLRIQARDHGKITDFSRSLSEHFVEGGKYSAESQRAFASKADVQVCKIAANLHAMSSGIHSVQIESDCVDAAINIMAEMVEAHLPLLGDKGLIGDVAAYRAVIAYLDNRKYPLSTIKQNCRNKIPFKNHPGNVATHISQIVDQMIRARLLVVEVEPSTGKELISVA